MATTKQNTVVNSKKPKSIDIILANIEKSVKNTGAPVVEKAPTMKDFSTVPAISFGFADVDAASFCGGIPQGKMVEIFGPESGGKSLLSLNLIASAQKSGMVCCLVDAENSYDPVWADSHGVCTDDLYIMRSSISAEQILEYVDKICESGVFGLIVVDSTAALIPQKELEGSISDQNYALLARAMSTACRKIVSHCSATNTTCVFLNQIRDKMGVMFGCFHYNARVVLEDGTTEKIGKIVNNKMKLNVLSYNMENGKIESKKIVGWNDNGNLNEDQCFLNIVAEKHFGNGIINIPCTPNHIVFKNAGLDVDSGKYIAEEIAAGDLEVGDELLVKVPIYLTEDQKQIVYGSILGDGSLRESTPQSSQLRFGHGVAQSEYLQWKQEIMHNVVGFSDPTHFETTPLFELSGLKYNNEVGKNCNNVIPKEVVDKIGLLGLTIWYLDDGTFGGNYKKWGKGKSTIYCYKFSNKDLMMESFNRLGLNPKMTKRGFEFNAEETELFHSMICKYVPECMDYKIHPNYSGKYEYDIDDNINSFEYKLVPAKILNIYEKPKTKTKKKFDLTIDGNSNYFVDHALVHNSPETTPGGKALKFYAHQRIRVTPGKKIKVQEGEKEIIIARQSFIQFVKNKAARPFGECIVEIVFDKTARNPVVKLCKVAKDYKVVSLREGTFRISKELFDGCKKNVDTGAKTSVELADYLVKEKLVNVVLEAFVSNYIDEHGSEDKIDKDILALRDDPALIVSPLNGAIVDAINDAPSITNQDIDDTDGGIDLGDD